MLPSKPLRPNGLLRFLFNGDAEDFAPLVAYSNSTSPEETTALKVSEDSYQKSRFFTIRCSRKRLLLLIIVFLLILVSSSLLTTYFIILHSHNTCTTIGCTSASSALFERIDQTRTKSLNGSIIDVPPSSPCEDFYQYACGNWMERTIRRNANSWQNLYETVYKSLDLVAQYIDIASRIGDVLTTAEKIIIDGYQKCNTINIEQAAASYKNLTGYFDDIMDDKSSYITTIEQTLVHAYRIQAIALFSIGPNVDTRDTSRTVLTIEEMFPFMLSPAYYAADSPTVHSIIAGKHPYLTYVFKSMLELMVMAGYDLKEQIHWAAQLTLFECRIMQASPLNHGDFEEHFMTLHDLNAISAGAFDFHTFLEELTGYPTAPSAEINVSLGLNWLKRFLSVMAEYRSTPEGRAIINDYIKIKAFYVHNLYVGTPYATQKTELSTIYSIIMQGKPQSHLCIGFMSEAMQTTMPGLIHHMMIDKLEKNKVFAESIGDAIRAEYRTLLKNTKVIDQRDMDYAMRKLDNVVFGTVYPKSVHDESLYAMEASWMADRSLPWPLFYMKSLGAKRLEQMRSVTAKLNPDMWPSDTNTFNLNVHYNYEANKVIFPMVLSFEQYLDYQKPSFFSFGGYGSTLGHEITHAFDHNGRKFGPNGRKEKMFHNKTEEHYTIKEQCFMDQYTKLTNNDAERAKQTLNENIADQVGLEVAYKAWKKQDELDNKVLPGLNFSPDQAFFVAYAQNWCELPAKGVGTHSTGRLRVLGSVQNSIEFSKAFSCPLGTPMNPPTKCSLW